MPGRIGSPLFAAIALQGLLLGTSALAGTVPSTSSSVCIPTPLPVPGEVGPPVWWDAGLTPEEKKAIQDDSRWTGAAGVGHASDRARFQALYENVAGQDYLYFDFEIRGDDSFPNPPPTDSIYFGFSNAAGDKANIIRVTLPTGTSTDQQVIQQSDVFVYAKSTPGATVFTGQIGPYTLPWLVNGNSRYWVDCSGSDCSYRLQIRAPLSDTATPADLSSGLYIDDTFRFWYDMLITNSGSVVHSEFPVGLEWDAGWTTASPIDPSTAFQTVKIKDPTGCAAGIEILNSQVLRTPGSATGIAGSNVFHATPLNNTGGNVLGDAIAARFRISDWGVAGEGDDPAWDLPEDSVDCDGATGSGSVDDASAFDLQCDWDLTDEVLCKYQPQGASSPPWPDCGPYADTGTRHRKQCVLVDLSAGGASAGTIFFSRISTCRHPFTVGPPYTAAVPALGVAGALVLTTLLGALGVRRRARPGSAP